MEGKRYKMKKVSCRSEKVQEYLVEIVSIQTRSASYLLVNAAVIHHQHHVLMEYLGAEGPFLCYDLLSHLYAI